MLRLDFQRIFSFIFSLFSAMSVFYLDWKVCWQRLHMFALGGCQDERDMIWCGIRKIVSHELRSMIGLLHNAHAISNRLNEGEKIDEICIFGVSFKVSVAFSTAQPCAWCVNRWQCHFQYFNAIIAVLEIKKSSHSYIDKQEINPRYWSTSNWTMTTTVMMMMMTCDNFRAVVLMCTEVKR